MHRIALPLLLLAASSGVADACNVPVFRYALEHWHAAPYRLTLLHRDALDEAAQAHVAELQRHADASPDAFDFRTLDAAAAEDEADQALVAAVGDTPLPVLVLQYPAQFGLAKPFLTIPWDAAAPAKVADSPLRADLARRLAAGETAVWLVLQSGNREADEAAIALLTKELEQLESELTLPDPALGEVVGEAFQGPPVQIKFSVLPVAREGADKALVAMLLNSEPDLMDRDVPLIFPVFGRGRALFPLIGAGITAQNIAEYGEFLVGACSCQVKEQNPGFDLLLTTDWTSLLRDAGVPDEALEKPSMTQPTAPELVAIPRGTAGANMEEATSSSEPATGGGESSSKVTPTAAAEVASAQTPPASMPSSNRVAPWVIGVTAIGFVVAAVALWRRMAAPPQA